MASRNQPTYDFLTGESPHPAPMPMRESKHRQSTLVRSDPANEELRAQINTLQYELESLRQKHEMERLNTEKDLRDAHRKAEEEFRRAQTLESTGHSTSTRCDALARELQEAQDHAANDKAELERRMRALQEQNRTLQEETEEAQTELASAARTSGRRIAELEARQATAQQALDEVRADASAKADALQTAQQRLVEREAASGALEAELSALRAAGGPADEVAVLTRELSEQVAHIRKLETGHREQAAELRALQRRARAVEVVEEEKRGLEARLRLLGDVRRERDEATLQRRILEDERRAWSAYLESEAAASVLGADDAAARASFQTPEDLARALVQERLETASLLDQLGTVRSELTGKDAAAHALEGENARLVAEIERQRTAARTGGADGRVRARLERQRALAVKEVEYLRAQVQAFEAEESEFAPETHDAQRAARVQELEQLVDEHREEVRSLTASVTDLEQQLQQQQSAPPVTSPAALGTKRTLDAEDDERLGELRRKNRLLQEDHRKLEKRAKLLEADLRTARKQLDALQASSRTRILELRQNPTADAEALKLRTVTTLRAENQALLARLEGGGGAGGADAVVPAASLAAARLEIAELGRRVAEKEKMMARLKQIWSAKSLEFREAVASILGWKMDFMPNGRVRVTSMFHPGDEDEEGGGGGNSIVFDGENGTMKVSGGPQSVFAGEIREHIAYWVEGRKEVPCFLAALTLEFWERRAGTMTVG